MVLFVLKKFAFGPVQAMLEQRRARIAEGEEKLKRIEKQLADSEANTAAAIAKANEEAVRLINEAKQGAAVFSEQKSQEAIAQAQQILAKAETAAKADRDRLTTELKREFGRLVAADHLPSHRQDSHRGRPEAHQRRRARQGRRLILPISLP